MKIVYFGTPEFVVPVLELLNKNHKVVLIVTESAKPQGRGGKIIDSPIASYAQTHSLNIFTPEDFNPESIDKILSLKPDFLIVAAYGRILPAKLVNSVETINIHPSLLPKLRGPTPTQTALLKGLKETGVSIMVLDEKMDHGPILVQQKVSIAEADNYLNLEPKLFKLGAEMLVKNLPLYKEGKLEPKAQDHSAATYTKLLKKEDGRIDWAKPAEEIFNQYRAYVKWPGVFTFFKNKNGQDVRLKLIQVEKCAISDIAHKPGEIFTDESKNLYIACAEGAIKLTRLQPENSKILSPTEFLNGYGYIVGQILI